jgi:hypothetical protein
MTLACILFFLFHFYFPTARRAARQHDISRLV